MIPSCFCDRFEDDEGGERKNENERGYERGIQGVLSGNKYHKMSCDDRDGEELSY